MKNRLYVRRYKAETTDWIDDPEVEEVVEVYVYDPELAVYCCEVTPSHELWYVRTEVICREGTSDERREVLDDMYSGTNEEVTYAHASSVQRGETYPMSEYETIEEAIEDESCNWTGIA